MPKWSLHDVDFDEVSFVDVGAGPESHIVIAKRAADALTPGATLDIEVEGTTEVVSKSISKAVAEDGVMYVTADDGSVYMMTDISVTTGDDGDVSLTGDAADLTPETERFPDDDTPSDDPNDEPSDDAPDTPTGEGAEGMLAKVAKALGLGHLIGKPDGDPTPIAKADFNQIVAARMVGEVTDEIIKLVYAFEDATHDARWDMSGEAKDTLLKRNLADFGAAVNAAIDAWAERVPIAKRNRVFAPGGGDGVDLRRYTDGDVSEIAKDAVARLTEKDTGEDTGAGEKERSSDVVAKFSRSEIAKFAGLEESNVTDEMIAKFNGHAVTAEPDADAPPEGISKSVWDGLDDGVKSIIKSERARTDGVHSTIAKMHEDNEIATISKRVEDIVITGDPTEIAKRLYAIKKELGEDAAKFIEDQMRASATIAKRSTALFTQYGSALDPDGSLTNGDMSGISKAGETPAYQELRKLAEAHQSEHNTTFAKAMHTVSGTPRGRELTAQHREEAAK